MVTEESVFFSLELVNISYVWKDGMRKRWLIFSSYMGKNSGPTIRYKKSRRCMLYVWMWVSRFRVLPAPVVPTNFLWWEAHPPLCNNYRRLMRRTILSTLICSLRYKSPRHPGGVRARLYFDLLTLNVTISYDCHLFSSNNDRYPPHPRNMYMWNLASRLPTNRFQKRPRRRCVGNKDR